MLWLKAICAFEIGVINGCGGLRQSHALVHWSCSSMRKRLGEVTARNVELGLSANVYLPGTLCSKSNISRSGQRDPTLAIARMTKDGERRLQIARYEIDVVVLAAEVLLETLPIVIVVLLSGMALLAMISPKSLAGRTVLAPFLCYYEDVVG